MAAATPLAQAAAAPAAEVQQLVDQGKINDAAQRVQTLLKQSPQDVQLRFLQGVIAAEQQKYDQAIQVFTALTRDHPQLPEPYNNLAVLHAAKGEDRKAAQVLEQAIRTNPSYATAHENLGDVYAKLASQAYSKALQLDSGNTAVSPKLNLIRNLFAGGSRPATPAAPNTPAVAPPTVVATAPVVTQPPAPVASAPAQASEAQQREVREAVQAWAQAWSSKNMTAYLGAYAPNFTPGGGVSRANWEAERKARIVPRSRISVEVNDLVVTVNGDRASARFRQAYSSDNLNSSNRKTLDMVKSGNRWLIVREAAGS
jgi:tetratricopeptide (TPR) repeat protein